MKKPISLNDIDRAEKLLDRFLEGGFLARRMSKAEEISVLFDQVFDEDEGAFADLVIATSCYAPQGGEFLEDKKSILPYLRTAKLRIGRIRSGTIDEYIMVEVRDS